MNRGVSLSARKRRDVLYWAIAKLANHCAAGASHAVGAQ